MSAYRPKSIALTGSTGQLGRAFLAELAIRHPDVELRLLVRADSKARCDPEFTALLERFSHRPVLLDGDLGKLRLSDAAARALTGAEGGLWHLAASTNLSQRSAAVEKRAHEVNVQGTARLLALCAAHPPAHFFHVSTAYVAGNRPGVARENELFPEGRFRNSYERSKAAAEALVRDAFGRGLSGTIFRPSLIVEESDRVCPHSVTRAFAVAIAGAVRRGRAELTLRFPADAAVNLVPESFVVDAMLQLAAVPRSAECYHLTAENDFALGSLPELVGYSLPRFKFSLAPDLDPRRLDAASLLLDRMLEDLKPYCGGQPLAFDRSNLERDLPCLPADGVDWRNLVGKRLNLGDANLCAMAS